MRRSLVVLATLMAAPCWAGKPNVKNLVNRFEAAKTEERIRIAAVLGRVNNKKAVEALIRAFDIRRGNPRESAAIVDALGLAGDPRAVEPLVTAWDYLRSMVLQMGELPGQLQVIRWKTLEALSRLGGEQALAVMTAGINDKDLRVVEEAVRGMGRLRVKDAVPALQELVTTANGNLLQAILEALGDIGDRRALSTLEQAKASPDKYVEVEVAYALAKLGQKESLGRLQGIVNKRDPGEQKLGLMAAYYLVKLDDSVGLEHLERTLKKMDAPLAALAAETLGKTENQRAVLVLAEAFRAPDYSVRVSVARALGRLGGPRSINILKRMRDDAHPSVHSAAVTALTGLGELE